MLTCVLDGPVAGLIAETKSIGAGGSGATAGAGGGGVGAGAVYVNPPVDVVVPVSLLVTTTFFAPAVPAGVVQVIDVAVTTVTELHATPSTVTVAPETKPVPVIVIAVPPAVDPDDGVIAVIEGATMLGVHTA